MKENRILGRINDGESAVGCALNVNSPHLVELMGSLGYDWVFIDCEHGSMTEPQVENMVRAAETYGMTSVVRVPANESYLILRHLDLGAMGIVVPHVDSPADAKKAAAAAKYPPLGARGSNYGTGRNNEYGAGTADALQYYERSNAATTLFALIESGDAVEAIEGIVGTDGVDATWLGPADMALSMGLPEQSVIDDCLDRVVSATVDKGKIAAVTHLPPGAIDRLEHFHRLGARVFAVQPFNLLRESGAEWLHTVRDRVRR